MEIDNTVTIFDPLSIDGLSGYTAGLCEGLYNNGKKVDLICNKNYPFSSDNYVIKRFFFNYTQNFKKSKIRTYLRGLEYFYNWIKVLLYLYEKKPSTLHIIWLLHYRIDRFFLKILQLFFNKIVIVYTAHNVIPHNATPIQIKHLKQIYSKFDTIIVHGTYLKKKLLEIFPRIDNSNIIISKHGIKKELKNEEGSIDISIKEFLSQKNKKIVLFLGLLNYNKGVDLLYKQWIHLKKDNVLLVIAGQKNSAYRELANIEHQISSDKTVLYLPKYLTNIEVSYLFKNCHCVLLPYRHGSVSGVLFDASFHKKPTFSTNFGAIRDYIIDNKTGFVSFKGSEGIKELLRIINDLSINDLENMGKNAFVHFKENYDWDNICQKLLPYYK
ncbi:glycosyltransferase family 4 protein [Aquimarina sp. ERC-38]|uniref:glycosyltransferase family 4 protein n=1 Tax=Aquimarina sp. ERC-38 TaxID=2949996 RepID=UPI0022468CE2|nr:glycosyltransferase family 4 protein [Aquimarina sp. ERC-38]UZO81863.1 glycosyltransferase family 4 protein [Aquimarina sp. ERC-38]